MNSKTMVVIPARLASSRLEQKLLKIVGDKSVLQHTYEATLKAKTPSKVLVAVDDVRLAELCDSFGADWVMTDVDCPSGTDRIAQALRCQDESTSDCEIVVNVQGDEPEIDADAIDAVAHALSVHPFADMATAAAPIRIAESLHDPSIVKIVAGSISAPGSSPASHALESDLENTPVPAALSIEQTEQSRAEQGAPECFRAIYFSRAPVPFCRDGIHATWLQQSSPSLCTTSDSTPIGRHSCGGSPRPLQAAWNRSNGSNSYEQSRPVVKLFRRRRRGNARDRYAIGFRCVSKAARGSKRVKVSE